MIKSDTFQYLPISFAATIFFSNNNSGKVWQLTVWCLPVKYLNAKYIISVSAAQKPWYLNLNEPLRLTAALNFPKPAQLF